MHTGLVVVLLFCLWPAAAKATMVDQAALDLEIKAPPTVRLSLTPRAISFPDTDPDAASEVAAGENPVKVTILGRGSQITLTARAFTHLISGVDQIDISKVSWTATGSGFLPGRLMLGADILVGQWPAPFTGIIRGGLSFFSTKRLALSGGQVSSHHYLHGHRLIKAA